MARATSWSDTERGQQDIYKTPDREENRHADDTPKDELSTLFATCVLIAMNEKISHHTPDEHGKGENEDEWHDDGIKNTDDAGAAGSIADKIFKSHISRRAIAPSP
jgi:hypothetical protein